MVARFPIPALGGASVDVQIVVDANTPRLSNGIFVLLRTFVAGGE